MDYIKLIKENPPTSPNEKGYWSRLAKIAGIKKGENMRGRLRKYFKYHLKSTASVETIYELVNLAQPQDYGVHVNEKKTAVTFVGNTPKTLEEIFKEANISEADYEVKKIPLKVWSTAMKDSDSNPMVVENWSIGAELKPRGISVENFKEIFEEGVRTYSVPDFTIFRKDTTVDENLCGVLNIFDAHINRLAWKAVVGEDGDVEKGCHNFRMAFDSLLSYLVTEGIHTLFFPVGNDFFNTDGHYSTKRGTPQPMTDHPKKSFLMGIQLLRECVDKALSYVPEIVIPYVLANHDPDEAWKALICLKYIYENEPRVKFDIGPKPIKAYQWGVNMFAFDHGHVGKAKDIGKVIAELFKHMHAATSYRKVYRGHYHSKNDPKEIDTVGYNVYHLRSMSIASEWEYYSYYVGVKKGCEAHTFHKEYGPSGNLDKIFF